MTPRALEGARSTVLVLGGSGAVGRALTGLLTDDGILVVAASRRPPASLPPGSRFRAVDLRDTAAVADAVADAAVVVDATGVSGSAVASSVVAAGGTLVDLDAGSARLADLGGLDAPARASGATVLAGVGLAPGLTNLLAAAVFEAGRDRDQGIELSLVLGLGEHHGPAAVAWTLDQLAAPPRHPRRRVDLPAGFGSRVLRWVDFGEQHALTRDLGVPVVSRCALDPPLLGTAMLALARARALHPLLQAAAGPVTRLTRRDWWLAAAHAGDGTTCWATGRRQSDGTAAVAAWAVHRLLDQPRAIPAGVHDLHRITDLASVAPWLQRHGITTAGHASSAGAAVPLAPGRPRLSPLAAP